MTQRPAVISQSALDIKCAVCQQQFEYRLELIKHVQQNHSNDNVSTCGICSKTFANVLLLLRHTIIHKFPSRRVSCKLCYKSFLYKHYLKLHLRRHAGERRYYCFVCETSYKSKDSLTKHKEIHLENHVNDGKTDLFCQIKETESLQNLQDTKQNLDLNIDPLNTKLKHKNEMQVNSDTKMFKNFSKEECDQLEDNTNTNDSQQLQSSDGDDDSFILDENEGSADDDDDDDGDDDDDDDDFILEKNPKRKTKSISIVDTKCAVCHKKFQFRLDFINHAQQNHPKAKCFKCTICSKTFVNYYSITRHRRIHKDTAKRHVCEYCSKCFLDRNTYESHLNIHTNNIMHSCPVCDKLYTYKRTLNIHLKKAHLEYTQNNVIKKELAVEKKCAVCQQEFEYRVDLIKHARLKHPNDKVFKCSLCPMVFKHISSITNHRADHKNLPKKYMCKLCPKSFRDKQKLNQHMIAHSTEPRYKCSLCDKTFKYQTGFKYHQKKHARDLSENRTIKKYKPKKIRGPPVKLEQAVEKKCAVCQQEFKYRFELVRHAQLNHPNDKAFKCGHCSVVVANVVSMSRHSRVHKVSKIRFSCKLCSKSFFRKDNLKLHLRTHKKESPYYCFVCETSHKCKDSLEKHLKIHLKGDVNEDTADLDCQNNDNKNYKLEGDQLKDNSKINTEQIDMSDDNDDDLILEENSNQPKKRKLRTISAVDTKCAVCHEEFIYRLDLINHAKQYHPNDKVFKCSICSMVFSNYNVISRHRSIHKDIGKEYVCEHCPKTFLNRYTFKSHVKKVHLSKIKYFCSFCDKSYKQKASLDNHLKTHLEKGKKRRRILKERAVETKCAVCQKEFEYREDLMKHAKIEHPNDKVFKCSICPMVFKHISSLTNHRAYHKNLAKAHSSERGYKCSLCNKSYKYKNSFRTHLKFHLKGLSKNKKPKVKKTGKRITKNQRAVEMKCAVCQQEFKYRQDFIKHAQLEHPNDKVFKCSICFMVFENISSLSNHQTEHKKLPPKYVCTFCPKSYRVKQKLDQHMKVHSTESCHTESLCDKTYERKNSLQKHQTRGLKGVSENTEIEVKSSRRYPVKIQQAAEMKCAICQQKFEYSFELVKHAQQNHPNDKALKCINCSMVFVNALALSCHSEIHEVSQTKTHLKTDTKERETRYTRKCSRNKDGKGCENKNLKSLQIPDIESQNIFKIKSKLKISLKGDQLEDFSNTNASQQIMVDNDDDDDDVVEELQTDYVSKQVDNKADNISRENKILGNSIDDDFLLEELTNPSNPMLALETKCGVCHKEFYCRKDLIEHVTRCHSNAKAFKCTICFKLFSNVYSLAKHKSLHKSLPEKHICPYCSKVIENLNEFTRHLKTHAKHSARNDRRVVDKRCGACHKQFQYRQDLVEHVNEFHPNTKAFKCNLCPMVFKNLNYISTHRRYTHKLKPKKYFCEICSCYLRDKGSYKNHLQSTRHKNSLKNHHEGPSNEKVQSSLSEIIISDDEKREIFLDNHQKLLSKQKSNKDVKDNLRKTIICNDTHKENQSLSNSVIKKELITNCESEEVQDVIEITKTEFVYDETFTNAAIRVDNNCSTINDITAINKTIPNELSNPHVCELCLETFTSIFNLKIHLLSHTKEFPFLCSFCNRRFKSYDKMKFHQTRIHSDILSSLIKNVNDETNNRVLNHKELLEIGNSNDNAVMENIEDQFGVEPSNGRNNQDNIIDNKKPISSVFIFQKDSECLRNSNEIECFNHTSHIKKESYSEYVCNEIVKSVEEQMIPHNEIQCLNQTPLIKEESYSDNVLETSKAEYVHNETMNFQISGVNQSIEKSMIPHNESPYDSLDKSIDVGGFQEEFTLHHFQNIKKGKGLANEPLCNVETIYRVNNFVNDSKSVYDEVLKCRQTVARGTVERKCAVCQEEFNCRRDLIKHVQQYHPKAKGFKCSLCPKLFSNVRSIIPHGRKHKELPTVKACPSCPETFIRMDYFMEHLKEHRKARHNCTPKNVSFNKDNEEKNQDNYTVDVPFNYSTDCQHSYKQFIESEQQSERVNNIQDIKEETEELENVNDKSPFEIKEEHFTDTELEIGKGEFNTINYQ